MQVLFRTHDTFNHFTSERCSITVQFFSFRSSNCFQAIIVNTRPRVASIKKRLSAMLLLRKRNFNVTQIFLIDKSLNFFEHAKVFASLQSRAYLRYTFFIPSLCLILGWYIVTIMESVSTGIPMKQRRFSRGV